MSNVSTNQRDHMLEALHAKAKAKNLEVTVWKDFVEDLKRPGFSGKIRAHSSL